MLPSILDSKIWKVKCKLGMEKQLVVQLLKKAVDYLNNHKPFMILSVFNCERSHGVIYIEAYNMSHVKSFIDGITGIFRRGIEMIPYREMT
jgi:transcription elongation factor SPT5